MNLLRIIGFGLKVGHLLLLLCCWFLSIISLNWLSNERAMITKSGLPGDEGQAWKKLLNRVSDCVSKIHHHYSQYFGSRREKNNWWRKFLIGWLAMGIIVSLSAFWYMSSQANEKRKETLASMCDERARMLQDQFNVSMNHIQAMSVMISIFHHGKNPSAIDQSTFARYTERTSFERPLTSGVAYAVRVLHSEREQFEAQQGWTIKRMDKIEKNPVHDDKYNQADLEPSLVQEEYAPVIFAQETVAHVISVDMLSGKEDRENVLRARESGKGVLTAPFRLLKTNRLGVILTFAVYKRELPPDAKLSDRIQETAGVACGENSLHQLASKQTILVNVYDMTNSTDPISMYGSNPSSDGLHRVSSLNFGDPFRKHEMHCRFKQKQPWPLAAIFTSVGILVIDMLVAQIIYATVNRIAKVEDDYHQMMELKRRAEAADVAKSQFLATVSHEIRTPMNGVLGMLQMLMDTRLDETQQDYVRTARESGKALVSLINEVLDQAKIESGKLELEAVSFDLRAILDDVLSLFSGKSQDKKVELAVYVSSKVPSTLIGDPGRFRQIVTNLVGNSIKFTDKGHIFVTVYLVEEVMETEAETGSSLSGLPVVDRRRSWSRFRVFSQDNNTPLAGSSPDQVNVMVSVEDTGQGIPVEAQSRVFNPFMQVGPSITRTHGGTGIGLSISKCLVQLMKGEIGLASTPQVGSTFTFTAVFTAEQQQQQQQQPNSSEFHGTRALLVDSNPVRAKVSRYHIQRLGIQVEVVPEVGPGLKKKPVQIVFVEEEMWERNVEELGKGSWQPKILILSNSPGIGPPPVPAVAVVVKPLRVSMVGATLQRAMGGLRGNRGTQDLLHKKLSSLSGLLQGRRILVVDDNRVNLRVAAGCLKKYGADVVHAERGKEAISLLTPPHLFHACFMDIQMPEMDGFEATRRIRDIESGINKGIEDGRLSLESYGNVSNWHVPILAMTADVIQATSEECSKCGMDGYVSKPFEADQLYREVSRFFHTGADDNHQNE
uniref:histidine kinase n=1 Tax=Striga asiatica TaxID=4170 RepID=Q1ZYM1_STRAF|nr:histidine kinase SHK278 [Striga asiatica]